MSGGPLLHFKQTASLLVCALLAFVAGTPAYAGCPTDLGLPRLEAAAKGNLEIGQSAAGGVVAPVDLILKKPGVCDNVPPDKRRTPGVMTDKDVAALIGGQCQAKFIAGVAKSIASDLVGLYDIAKTVGLILLEIPLVPDLVGVGTAYRLLEGEKRNHAIEDLRKGASDVVRGLAKWLYDDDLVEMLRLNAGGTGDLELRLAAQLPTVIKAIADSLNERLQCWKIELLVDEFCEGFGFAGAQIAGLFIGISEVAASVKTTRGIKWVDKLATKGELFLEKVTVRLTGKAATLGEKATQRIFVNLAEVAGEVASKLPTKGWVKLVSESGEATDLVMLAQDGKIFIRKGESVFTYTATEAERARLLAGYNAARDVKAPTAAVDGAFLRASGAVEVGQLEKQYGHVLDDVARLEGDSVAARNELTSALDARIRALRSNGVPEDEIRRTLDDTLKSLGSGAACRR